MGTSGACIPLLIGDAQSYLTTGRTRSQRTQAHMIPCSSRFTLAAIRPRSPLQPVKMAFTLSTYPLEMFTTASDVRMSAVLFFSLFCLFREVSAIQNSRAGSIVKLRSRKPKGRDQPSLPKVPTASHPRITLKNPKFCAKIHEDIRYCTLCRLPLSTHHLWYWPVHHRLPGTSPHRLHRHQVVSLVGCLHLAFAFC